MSSASAKRRLALMRWLSFLRASVSFDATESGLPSLIASARAAVRSPPQADVTRLRRRPGLKVRAEAIASLVGSQLARLDPLIDRAAGCTLLTGGVARLPRFVRVDPACTEMPQFSRTKGANGAPKVHFGRIPPLRSSPVERPPSTFSRHRGSRPRTSQAGGLAAIRELQRRNGKDGSHLVDWVIRIHSSGNPALRRPSNNGGTLNEWVSIHLTVSSGLWRRASAKADAASSILPASA